jgi:ABC-type amino acid transport substrate-binding protein
MKDGKATGFDIELMRAVCGRLSLELRPLCHEGENFNDIFKGLAQGRCDAVISGTTITPDRVAIARFSRPYLQFNQGIAVNRRPTPHASSTAGLRGIVARRLLAQGDIASIEYYPYHGIGTALDDLEAGRIGLVIKLFPVISWLTRERPDLAVAMQVPTHEQLGIAYAPESVDLCDAVDSAIEALRESGEFAKLQAAWPGTGATL